MIITKPSVILIGMPGAGKSTLGVQLAKTLALDFVDTDLLIQLQSGETLQSFLDREGYLALRELEAQVLLNHDFPGAVVATGGSAVYGDAAMQHLKRFGPVVFLHVPLTDLEARITDHDSRGIAKAPQQSFADVYAERLPLYERYADISVNCHGRSETQVLADILAQLG